VTTPPSFPTLPGKGFSVHKLPSFSTRVAGYVSGRETRVPLYYYTLYEFELVIDALDSAGQFSNLVANSLQSLMGLYLQVQGQYGTFLYTDSSDYSAAGQGLGDGDGHTTNFTIVRALGGWVEPVGWVTDLENVYLGGVLQSSSTYSLTTPNTLVFNVAPGSDVLISADFTYAFQCRFLADQEDFEEFMSGLWQVKSLKFRSVRPYG